MGQNGSKWGKEGKATKEHRRKWAYTQVRQARHGNARKKEGTGGIVVQGDTPSSNRHKAGNRQDRTKWHREEYKLCVQRQGTSE